MKLVMPEELHEFLSSTAGWEIRDNFIVKEFIFGNFVEALSFVLKCGIESEKLDHHPSMLLYDWNKVKITINTHSLNGLTEKDLILAKQIEKIN